ncbi:MAG: SpoIID/LytB domain-containing protein [Chlamydiales bacterium]|nr:SpoIID/LytB domain-containing protein [Chlamydiales bacterium]
MRAFVFCGLLLMLPLGAAPVGGSKEYAKSLPAGPKIKVLLEKDANSAFLEVRGPYRVVRKDTGEALSSGSIGKRFVVHALADGLRWGEEYPDIYQISVVPTHSDCLVYVDGIQYKGTVSVYHVRNSRITIVNEVPIEDFLKSTLALHYDRPFEREAMCALAIAARTEAYAKVLNGKRSKRPWEVTAQEAGYYGWGVTQQKNGVEAAVDWTRFMVLESSNSGGPAQSVPLARSKAEELAGRGYDAKKILQSSFPGHKLGITINPDEVAARH